ncbi:NifU family protein [Sneathiella limimaris]|uniref:NifU family protein n=1 Tax=Sneathiella limimaris TaxID=1964213 RepID=UPI00146E5EB2|nr:NifU family protein [Sneathiella limimaris]
MFIQTQSGDLPNEMEFFPGREVLGEGSLEVARDAAGEISPLAARIYQVAGIESVTLLPDSLLLARTDDREWDELRTEVFSAIMAHFQSGDPVQLSQETEEGDDFTSEIIDQVKDLLETRIVPAVTQSGGDVAFHSYKDGNLYLKMQGSAFSMLTGITNMLRHYVPEIKAVLDHREALPRPGLQSEEGVAIRDLLQERINPSIAAHGGHITLVDVQEEKAFVRLEGGCQGCGMADVTLKQGVAKEIMTMVPKIKEVLDVTDHAGGTNPYYQPA